MNNNMTICIDLAKEVFQVAVFNQAGKAKLNKEVTAKKMCLIIAQYPDAAIYMEACVQHIIGLGALHHQVIK
jgi:hypothetical protein